MAILEYILTDQNDNVIAPGFQHRDNALNFAVAHLRGREQIHSISIHRSIDNDTPEFIIRLTDQELGA